MGVEISQFRAVPVGDRFGVEARVGDAWVPVGAVGTVGPITFGSEDEAKTDAANRQKAVEAMSDAQASARSG